MKNINLTKIQRIFECFLLFCIFGWLYEVIWCNLIDLNIGWQNNGFLFGPWLPIYGFGMSIIVLILNRFKIEKPFEIFVYGTVISTVAELIGSYFMEFIMGKWLWDYTKYFGNFQGRIAIKPSIMFGLLVLLGVYVVLPKFQNFQEKYRNNNIKKIISLVIILLFILDLILRFKYGSNLS